MKITDEMVEEAQQRFFTALAIADVRRILESVAPLIAKAEAEECAGIAKACWELWDRNSNNGGSARHAYDSIRARHATPTPSTPQEK